MALRIFQCLGIVLALSLLADCTEHGGDSASSTEDALDSNYDLPSQADNEKEYAEDLSNDNQDQNENTEQGNSEKGHANLEDIMPDSNNYLDELKNQIIDTHSKNEPREIKYDVVQQFGNNEDEKFSKADNPLEIRYETVNRYGISQHKLEETQQKQLEETDYNLEGNAENASVRNLINQKSGTIHNKTKKISSKVQGKGKKHMSTHLLESHLETEGTSNQVVHSDSHLPVKILNHMEDYEEQEVEPLHLACTAATMSDTFPVKEDINFSQQFGLESEAFLTLQSYLEGQNVEGRKIALNFPVFLTVTPLLNNTVERAICVWLSNFSSLIPPEMDRHLGFLEIPQPQNQKIEIYASGQKIKYARTFVGFANDWIYRKEVKKLLDAIIDNGDGDMMDFRSYCVDIEGGNKHTVSFVKKVLQE